MSEPDSRLFGCMGVLALFGLIGTCNLIQYRDANTNQTALQCEHLMKQRILEKVAKLRGNKKLVAPKATIEHWLRGNKPAVENIAERTNNKSTIVPIDEVGWVVKIQDDPEYFFSHASRRISQLCRTAADNHVKYKSWWLMAGSKTDYVSQ